MNPKHFEKSSAGKCILVPSGSWGIPTEYWSFVPNSLPPDITYSEELVSLISEAHRLLGELSGKGSHLLNPYLLIAPSIRREAVVSSRMEGTHATLNDLFLFEAECPSAAPDVKEVANYVEAMEYGMVRLKELPICTRLICEIHKVLMEGVRGEHTTVGELRKIQNYIGPPVPDINAAEYVPPTPPEMEQGMRDLEQYHNSSSIVSPLVQCALIHYQFEALHPFPDGNGRVGRLLIIFFLFEKGFLSQPLLYLSAYFDRFRDEYKSRLLAVSQKGDWEGWVQFFLRGVIYQANDALSYTTKLLELHTEYQELLENTKNIPESAHRLIDEIFSNPMISISSLSRKMNIPYNSSKNGVKRLVDLGILKEMERPGKKRKKLFVAPKLWDLLTITGI